MPVYELGIATSSTGANAAMAEILSPTRPASILEYGFWQGPTGTTVTTELRRPSNTPAGGTAVNATNSTALEEGVGSGNSSLGIIISGWSTAPTVAAGGMVWGVRGGSIANMSGYTLGFLPGEMVVGTSRAQSLLLWGQSAPVTACKLWLRWQE